MLFKLYWCPYSSAILLETFQKHFFDLFNRLNQLIFSIKLFSEKCIVWIKEKKFNSNAKKHHIKLAITCSWNHVSRSLSENEYLSRHDFVGKVINWEWFKKFKFDHTSKWYMHKPTSLLENKTHELLSHFETQTDYLISARRPDLIIIKERKRKRACSIVDFDIPYDLSVKFKESEKKDKYNDLVRELKKLWNKKVIILTNVIGVLGRITKG